MTKTSSNPESVPKRLLTELANLHDDGAKRFWRIWPTFRRERNGMLLALREELRNIWRGETPALEIPDILNRWLNWQHRGLEGVGYLPWRVSFEPLGAFPHRSNLRGFLAIALLRHLRFLAVCGNPECPARYFVARRKDQKYCQRGECTEHAQRQYALKNWNKKGKQRRAERRQKQLNINQTKG